MDLAMFALLQRNALEAGAEIGSGWRQSCTAPAQPEQDEVDPSSPLKKAVHVELRSCQR
jgi:hypothetical protein